MKALAARRHHRLAPVVLLLLALLLTGGAVRRPGPEHGRCAPTGSTEDIETGKKLFQANCATCHGANAEGTRRRPSLVGVGAAAVDFQVGTGRMPMQMNGPQAQAKPAQFTEEQIAALAAYVASLGAGPAIPTDEQVDPPSGDPPTAWPLFRTNCAMCHNAVGAGGALSEGKFAPALLGARRAEHLRGDADRPAVDAGVQRREHHARGEARHHRVHRRAARAARPAVTTLGALGPVSEGLWAWVVGLGLLIGAAVWIGAKSS